MTDLQDLIGRQEINDLDAILSATGEYRDETIRAVTDHSEAIFTWNYDKGERPPLEKLYEKAKVSQWNGETDLPWETEVDIESVVLVSAAINDENGLGMGDFDATGTPFEKFSEKEWVQLGIESNQWTLSQFMHGEQGALICTAKIVETVPWIDAKYYASTQVMDEARHVEVFARYLDEKLGRQYAINPNLKALLDDILTDSRWDVTYLGMQIMVEGLALAAFGFMRQATNEPLLQDLLRYVMSDEARHVAFGVLSLQEYYGGLTSDELRERQEFAFDAAVRLQKRFRNLEVWERMGVDGQAVSDFLDTHSYEQADVFQTMLFSKIVPNCKKLGLLDAADGWLRDRFTEIGVIQFEDWVDTAEEYEALDEVAADRAG